MAMAAPSWKARRRLLGSTEYSPTVPPLSKWFMAVIVGRMPPPSLPGGFFLHVRWCTGKRSGCEPEQQQRKHERGAARSNVYQPVTKHRGRQGRGMAACGQVLCSD